MAEKDKRSRQPNGRSSIYLGKDGKWHGRVTVGIRDDGKPDRRHVERKTRAKSHTRYGSWRSSEKPRPYASRESPGRSRRG